MAKIDMTEKIANLMWEITHLLTPEDLTVVKKTPSECTTYSDYPSVSGEWGYTQKPITERPPSHSSVNKRNPEQEILDLTHKIIELLTGEVPIRCQDVSVYFSMEEWEYIEGHKDMYKDVILVGKVQDISGLKVDESKTGLTKIILNLTLDVLAQLTGEQYMILENDNKTVTSSSHMCLPREERSKWRSGTNHQPHLLVPEGSNEQKILKLTNKVIELLTEEVPVRCQDVSIYFSMEEWEYMGEHKDLYKDVIIEDHQTLASPEKIFPKNAATERPKKTNVRKKKFPCTACGKSFKQNSKLVRHQMSHTGIKPYTCSECTKSFISKADLTRHQMVHTGEKPFTCSECGKMFSQKWNLSKHWNAHIQDKIHKSNGTGTAVRTRQPIRRRRYALTCTECGKQFPDQSHLDIHHKVHTGEKPYLCKECGKCFAHKFHLSRHLKIHTGERPYLCQECGKGYICNSELAAHMKSHEIKTYSCTECDQTFTSKRCLITHHREHTGEEVFSCSECSKTFCSKSGLAKHLRVHVEIAL